MDSTTTSMTGAAADRRRAHRRVGVAATASFLALLLLGATRGPAHAEPAVPASTPEPTRTVLPAQPTQPVPSQPQQSAPVEPDPDARHDHDGWTPRGGGGDRGGGLPGGYGGGGERGGLPGGDGGGGERGGLPGGEGGGGERGGLPGDSGGGGTPGGEGAAPAPSTSGGAQT